MIEILAQATQQTDPGTGVWWNISVEKLGLIVAGLLTLITGMIVGGFKVWDLLTEKFFGWKSRKSKLQAELIKQQLQQDEEIQKLKDGMKALAKTSEATSVQPSPADVAKVNEIAKE